MVATSVVAASAAGTSAAEISDSSPATSISCGEATPLTEGFGFAVTGATIAATLSTAGAVSATVPLTTVTVREAASEYAQCLRDNGIDDYPEPQILGAPDRPDRRGVLP